MEIIWSPAGSFWASLFERRDHDGQGGKDGAPHDVDTVADFRKLIEVLEKRGYSAEDIENVMFKNWQRFFEKWLPNSI